MVGWFDTGCLDNGSESILKSTRTAREFSRERRLDIDW